MRSTTTLRFVAAMVAALFVQNHAHAEDPGPGMAIADEYRVPVGTTATVAESKAWQERRRLSLARHVSPHYSVWDYAATDLAAIEASIPNPGFDINIVPLVNGSPTTEMLSVGMLLGGNSVETAYSRCTVTLTKPDTVVTARHCLEYPHGDTFWVFFQFGGVRKVKSTGVNLFCKSGDTGCTPDKDLAIASLESPYTFLPTATVGTSADLSAATSATIVGFGMANPDAADVGFKRKGSATPAPCQVFPSSTQSICFQYNAQGAAAAQGLHANCNSDSGGPMLVNPTGKVLGVASELAGDCDGAGEGRYVNVTDAAFQSFMQNAGCGGGCSRQSDLFVQTMLSRPSEFLDPVMATRSYSINVPDNAQSLVVTMNHSRGWYDDVNNLNLAMPGTLNAQCQRFVDAEVCTADQPTAGTYTLNVSHVHGHVDFQLTAVALFALQPPP